MTDYTETKQGKKEMKKLSQIAYEEDLRRSLLPLSIQFEKWKQGQASSFEVAEAVQVFHDGPARELNKLYNYDDHLSVSAGIAKRLIIRETVSNELLESLSRKIEYFKEEIK